MKTTIPLFFALLVFVAVAAKPAGTDVELNVSPIIGIVVKEIGPILEKTYPGKFKSFIPASTVKFVEGGGGRVIPVWLGQDEKYYEEIVKKTNGILFLPGQNRFSHKCGSTDASLTLYKLATAENERGNYYPILSVGQGMETLLYVASDKNKNHVHCSNNKMGYSLKFEPDFKSSKLYEPMPRKLIETLQTENIAFSYHDKCLTKAKLKELKLTKNWRVLSTNVDENDMEFVSSLEHKTLPFYAVQFRPALHLYEGKRELFEHSLNAVLSSQYFAAFFVHEARKNQNKFENAQAEQKELIYNYPATYTKKDGVHYYEQCYLFGADKGTTC